jgi:hypothetical protein
MVFNATFNDISVMSWQSVLWVEQTRVSRENHRPAASHRQTLSHNIVSTMHWITNQKFFPEAVKSVYLCIIFFIFVDLQKVDNI